MGTLKTRDWKTRHQTAGVENAGVEIAGVWKYRKRWFQKCVSDCIDWAHRVETDSNVTAERRWAE